VITLVIIFYFLQILVEILSFDNINKFFDITQNDFTEICISPHGTRVIQKIIDKIFDTHVKFKKIKKPKMVKISKM